MSTTFTDMVAGSRGGGKRGSSPGTGLADPYPWTGKVLPQPLVVLREAAELKLGHGLLVWTRVHGSNAGWAEELGLAAVCATLAGDGAGEKRRGERLGKRRRGGRSAGGRNGWRCAGLMRTQRWTRGRAEGSRTLTGQWRIKGETESHKLLLLSPARDHSSHRRLPAL